MEIVWKFLKNLRIESSYDPATPLLCIYLRNLETFICKDVSTSMFLAALFTVAKTGKQRKCPSVDDRIKTDVLHMYNGTPLSLCRI